MEKLKNYFSSLIQGLELSKYGKAVPALLLIGLSIRLVLAPFTSHPYDFAVWASTVERSYNLSISPFFDWKFGTFLSAPFFFSYPLYLIFLQFTKVQNILVLQLILKLPLILADMGIAVVLFALAIKSGASQRQATLLMAFWIFNPFAIFVSAVHGQIEAFSILFVILSIYFLQQKKFLYSFVSLIVGGMFEYWPLLLVIPFVLFSWKRTDKKTKIAGFASLLIIPLLNYAPFLADPLLREQFFSGLSSSFSTAQVSGAFWVIVRSLGLNTLTLNSYSTLILMTVYLSFLVVFALNLVKHQFMLNFTVIVKAYLVAALIFLAFIPVADPQFLLWILPLLLYFSFIMKKPRGYVLATLLWIFSFAALFTSLTPFVYLLNAIPNVITIAPFSWPYVNYSLNNLFNIVFSLLLFYTLFNVFSWGLSIKQLEKLENTIKNKVHGTNRFLKQHEKPFQTYGFRNKIRISLSRWFNHIKRNSHSIFTIGMSLLAIGLLLSFVFYPAFDSRYFQNTPENPVDLYRLNNIQSPSEKLDISGNASFSTINTQIKVYLASWLQKSNPDYTNCSLVINTNSIPDELIVNYEGINNIVLISSINKVDQVFMLEQSTEALEFKIFIGESAVYKQSDLKNLYFNLYYPNGSLVQSFTADEFQSQSVGQGWSYYTFNVIKPLVSGLYNLSASVENSSLTWLWSGGGFASGVDQRYVNGLSTGTNNWIEIYETNPLIINFNGNNLGTFIFDDSNELTIPLTRQQLPLLENNVSIYTDKTTSQNIDQIFVDINLNIQPANPWWTNHMYIIVGIAVIGIVLLGTVLIFYAKLLRSSVAKNLL